MSFKFSLISDMHVDFPQPKTPYDKLEEFVVVAGDTSNGLLGLKFLNKLKNKGHQVFAVDGNHEHYSNRSQGRFPDETERAFYDGLAQGYIAAVNEDLTIIGSNGWYEVRNESAWQNYMTDSFNGLLTAEWVNERAKLQAAYIDDNLSNIPGRFIIVTHTAPCLHTLNPDFEGHFSNDWYWNPHMGRVMARHADKIAVWCHGHSHASADKIVDGVRVVCNPRGYPRENPEWQPLTIQI